MKCDQCEHVFIADDKFIQSIGTFDQPLFFCNDTCCEAWNRRPPDGESEKGDR